MKTFYKLLFSMLLAVGLMACGGGSDELEPTFEQLATPVPTTTVEGSRAVVSWPAVANADSYKIEIKASDNSLQQTKSITQTSYQQTMKEGVTYSFRVMATSSGNKSYTDSAWSTTVTAKCNQLSTPVVTLDAASVTNTAAKVSWTTVTNADGYHYQLFEETTKIKDIDIATTSLELTSLQENTTYTFKVKAVADSGYLDSEYSAEVKFTTLQIVKLSAPTNVRVTASGTTALAQWDAVEKAASYSYELYEGSATTALKSGTVSEPKVSFTELETGSYRFRVQALGKESDAYILPSDFSSEISFLLDGNIVDLGLPTHELDGVIRAFPGAEGGGMYTTGGRGGKVIHVTNLNDSGEGSLRWALEQSGPRTIVFDVCGTIQLKSTLGISKGDVTIAGQTAPGEGITLRDYTVQIKSSNIIIRYLRFRMGDETNQENDAIWGRYYENIIIDHCSMSWCTDECGSFYANKNFTLQWCLLGESLNNSVHGKGAHGYGGIWGGKNASFHHNLLASHKSRNPRFCHPQVYGSYLSTHRGNVDYRNNVVYNWGDNSSYGGESAQINMVNNYYKPGPASKDRKYFLAADAYYEKDGTVWSEAYPQLYVSGNVHTKYSDISADNKAGINFTDGNSYAYYQQFMSVPFSIKKDDTTLCYTSTHSAEEAYGVVLDYAGASLKRDAVDTRLVDDARNGKATYTSGGNGSTGGIIDTQSAVGGWPVLKATDEEIGRATTDSDGDHIPDYYEVLFGLNPAEDDATLKTLDPQGLYTNFEIYLHFLVKEITKGQVQAGTYQVLE